MADLTQVINADLHQLCRAHEISLLRERQPQVPVSVGLAELVANLMGYSELLFVELDGAASFAEG